MKSVVVILLICSSLTQALGLQRFDCDADKLEKCTQDLMRFGSDDIEVPSNEQEVLNSCALIKNGTRCIKKYMANCAPSVIRQMGKMAMGGVSRTINKRCSPEGVQTFLSHRDCIVSIKKPAQECYQGLVRDLYRIRETSNNNLLHPAVCCFISKMHECNSQALMTLCKEESQEFYGQETGKLMDEMMELICPTTLRWGLKSCTDIDAQMSASLDMPEGEKMSILPLILDLMKRLAE